MNNQKNLTEKILQASQKVNQASLRGSGNYVVLNKQSYNVFNALYRMSKIKRIFEFCSI
jgi:hypothetical protein